MILQGEPRMTSLYTITTEYEKLFSKLEILEELSEEESQEVLKELEINEETLKDKALNYCKRISYLKDQKESITQEIKRLQLLTESKQKEIDRLSKSLLEGKKVTGNEKLDLTTYKVSIRKSTQTNVKELENHLNDFVKPETKLTYKTPNKIIEEMIDILEKAGGLKMTKDGVEVSKTVAKKLYDSNTLTDGITFIQNENLSIK